MLLTSIVNNNEKIIGNRGITLTFNTFSFNDRFFVIVPIWNHFFS